MIRDAQENANWLIKILTAIFVMILVAVLFFSGQKVYGQTPPNLTITEAYQLARKNYPLVRQYDLITKARDYSVSNAEKGYLPTLSINGQATYQSTVTRFPFSIPIKGFVLPVYSKDQYKAYGEIDQVIYDGGLIKNQKETAKTTEVIQQQNLEVELYNLYDRVNQLFFGVLLIDEQLKQNDLLKQDIQNGIDKAKALVANGMAYRSSVDELSAQLLQSEQSRVDLAATKKAYLAMLGFFINRSLGDHTIIEKPATPVIADIVNRPELLAYEDQKKIDDQQEQFLNAELRPKAGFFAQGGYGRPGLNPLSNDFQWYYIGGLKLSWSLGSFYTLKNRKKLLDINRQELDLQKETFLFNTRLVQQQEIAEIQKYMELFRKDNAIISLRESVKKAAGAQLENGVLSAHDYITQVNAEDQARQNLILHEVQLLQKQYSYQNTTGNITNNKQ
jgi:outer membrane protein TolC